jgi:hypothetical protein
LKGAAALEDKLLQGLQVKGVIRKLYKAAAVTAVKNLWYVGEIGRQQQQQQQQQSNYISSGGVGQRPSIPLVKHRTIGTKAVQA